MKKNNGFSILEMAIVMAIIGLLLGGVMMGMTAQVDQRRFNDTQKSLEEIKDALIGYAIQNGHLPCPDKTGGGGGGTANDGQEDFVAGTGVCINQVGNIPWVTLGISDADAWGHRLHYAVTKAYSDRTPATVFKQSTLGTLSVCQTTTAPGGACVNPVATQLPAVILSFGPNGKGAITGTGALIPAATGPAATPPATNADEYQNSLANAAVFVSRPKSVIGGVLGEFDDQVAWLSSPTLVSRMSAAGKAPLP
jgi:prepilin-type N-terminal cleavage/methylation domain-containing protein